MKNNVSNDIKNIEDNIENSEKQKNKNNELIKSEKKKKNKFNEFKSKFDANFKVYLDIKNDIDEGKKEIPDIFKYDYEIFKKIEENSITKYNEKVDFYIKNYPKSIHYNSSYNKLFS